MGNELRINWESVGRAVFTRDQAQGAMPNGTRIVKVKEEAGDKHKLGDEGVVIGSVSHPEVMDGAPAYFVEWDDMPGVPVGVVGYKIAKAEAQPC